MTSVADRRTSLVVAAIAALAVAGCSGSKTPVLGSAGQIAPADDRVAAPDLQQTYVGGGSLDLAALKGHVVVLNVFGHWCENCIVEQPDLSRVASATMPMGVRYVGLAERDDDGDVTSYEKKYRVPYPAVQDTSGSIIAKFRALPVSAIPSTLVLDKQGREAARFVGQTDAGALTSVVTTLNAEAA